MPYARNADLPNAVRNVLPHKAQTIFLNAVNTALNRGLSEERAFKTAWGAVQNQGWRPSPTGKWVQRPMKKQIIIRNGSYKPKPEPKPIPDENKFECQIGIAKRDDEQQLITGIVMEPDTLDTQNEFVGKAEIQRAAHAFLEKSRVIGLQHSKQGPVTVVESYISSGETMGEQAIVKGSWVMTVKVNDAELWAGVKSGEYTGFSIGGYAAKRSITMEEFNNAK